MFQQKIESAIGVCLSEHPSVLYGLVDQDEDISHS